MDIFNRAKTYAKKWASKTLSRRSGCCRWYDYPIEASRRRGPKNNVLPIRAGIADSNALSAVAYIKHFTTSSVISYPVSKPTAILLAYDVMMLKPVTLKLLLFQELSLLKSLEGDDTDKAITNVQALLKNFKLSVNDAIMNVRPLSTVSLSHPS